MHFTAMFRKQTHVYVCMYMWRSEVDTECFSSRPYFLRHSLSENLLVSARLASLWAPIIYLSLSPSAGATALYHHAWLLCRCQGCKLRLNACAANISPVSITQAQYVGDSLMLTSNSLHSWLKLFPTWGLSTKLSLTEFSHFLEILREK